MHFHKLNDLIQLIYQFFCLIFFSWILIFPFFLLLLKRNKMVSQIIHISHIFFSIYIVFHRISIFCLNVFQVFKVKLSKLSYFTFFFFVSFLIINQHITYRYNFIKVQFLELTPHFPQYHLNPYFQIYFTQFTYYLLHHLMTFFLKSHKDLKIKFLLLIKLLLLLIQDQKFILMVNFLNFIFFHFRNQLWILLIISFGY